MKPYTIVMDQSQLKKQIAFLASKLDYNHLEDNEIELADGIFNLLSQLVINEESQ